MKDLDQEVMVVETTEKLFDRIKEEFGDIDKKSIKIDQLQLLE